MKLANMSPEEIGLLMTEFFDKLEEFQTKNGLSFEEMLVLFYSGAYSNFKQIIMSEDAAGHKPFPTEQDLNEHLSEPFNEVIAALHSTSYLEDMVILNSLIVSSLERIIDLILYDQYEQEVMRKILEEMPDISEDELHIRLAIEMQSFLTTED